MPFLRNVALLTAGAWAASRYVRRQRRVSFAGAVVVITGGSRGLGLELARRFAREGARLALLARDEEELALARDQLTWNGAEVMVQVCDITDEAEVEQAVEAVLERFGRVDVLVNNAGVIQVGPVDHVTLEDFEQALGVHVWGPLYLTKAVAPHMRRQGGGRIVNITSVGGVVAVPHLLSYCTSKFGLVGLSDGLRAELSKDDILVTTVCPGLMRTGSHVNALFKGRHEEEFAWFSTTAAFPLLSTSAAHAAARIVDACRHGDPHLTITLPAHLARIADGLFPGLVARAVRVANRLLPGPTDASGDRLRSGWESRSKWAPSFLTRKADEAIVPHNERAPQPGRAPLQDAAIRSETGAS